MFEKTENKAKKRPGTSHFFKKRQNDMTSTEQDRFQHWDLR